jgi:phospholipase/lecithinase/hemolysin
MHCSLALMMPIFSTVRAKLCTMPKISCLSKNSTLLTATRTQSVADCVSQQMRSLQQAYGARTFLILNLPPMQDSPGGLAATPDLREAKADWVAAYNQILNASVHSLENSVELFVFNTYDLFTTVLANATAYGFTNTTGYWNQNSCANLTYCPENPGGIMGANEYIWFDGTHVTSGMAFETKSFVQD